MMGKKSVSDKQYSNTKSSHAVWFTKDFLKSFWLWNEGIILHTLDGLKCPQDLLLLENTSRA